MRYVAEFDGYKLREIEDGDRKQLEEWIAADAHHASYFEPEFFMGRVAAGEGKWVIDPRATCYALEDAQGTVFYIRLSRASRVNIQFPPAEGISEQRRRIAQGLVQGMAFLEVALSRAGVEEWIFSSESPRLRYMAEGALNFAPSRHELVRAIAPGKEEPDVRRS